MHVGAGDASPAHSCEVHEILARMIRLRMLHGV